MTEFSSFSLRVDPAHARIDVPRQITVDGLNPGETVTIAAVTLRAGTPWQSTASFVADAQGHIDLTRDAPIAGDYAGVSPMGLIWSQSLLDPKVGNGRVLFNDDMFAGLDTTLTATRQSGSTATASLHQQLATDGVTRREVREEGLVGTLFLPAGPGPHPAVVIVNGSGGGINEPRAALYASQGYAAFALGYFKAPGLSDYISNTPLEYFETALNWVHRTLKPLHGFVALSGQSRGGELVLLLGSMFSELVSAVIGYVPGAVVHGAQSACDPATGRDGPAWLYRGEIVPHVWQNNRTATWAALNEVDADGVSRRHAEAVSTALNDPDAVARARIRVENIRGPVMLLSGTDDAAWPSSRYSRMVRERLAEVQHPYPVGYVDVDGAGHSILFPYVPTTQLSFPHPVSGRISTSGGTPANNAHADEASWAAVQKFLDDAVAARR
ncbi:palmitoyl-CoA hydrolase [Pigmentiphaga aceris]|uniref:Palmitoyl-CoA hydrolase n=1 Tax=Pigmentiphaga aceris TaxID=1940612 RepID=A0A5C0AUL8_9BURK|nr:acyl-CoA thioesterase/bile acid-CoA:amino acid N-acyltransferase family protein [Pigmentiphaga aceris]QEI05003.1 palmitoyl-CoA hydrolase [Pigmentiphaga aceris]